MITSAPAGAPILMYHEMAPRTERKSYLAVEPDRFAVQLAAPYDGGVRMLNTHELVGALCSRDKRVPQRAVVLTLDRSIGAVARTRT